MVATKPLPHWLSTWRLAEHLAVPELELVAVGVGVGEAVCVGVGVGVTVGMGDAV
jgi:hypothetical protein